MIVCGIDLSMSNTAVCLGPPEGPVNIGRYHSEPASRRVVPRIRRFEDLVARIMHPIDRYQPAVICIEGYAHNANTGNALALAELGGILRFHLVEITDQVFDVAPLTLKKFVLGKVEKGSKGKTPMIARLSRDYDVQFKSDDEYDAFALHRLALCLAGAVEPTSRAQRECMDTVLGVKEKTREEQAEKVLHDLFTSPPPF